MMEENKDKFEIKDDGEGIASEEISAGEMETAGPDSDAGTGAVTETEVASEAEPTSETEMASESEIEAESDARTENSEPVVHHAPEPRSHYERAGSIWTVAIVASIIGAMVGSTMMYFALPFMISKKMIPVSSATGQQIVINSSENYTIAQAVAKKATSSVVRISTTNVTQDMFFGSRDVEGVGSGVVIDSNGIILTNAHVVGTNPSKLVVNFSDGTTLDGKVLWKDAALDLAAVKVEATGLQAASLGDSDKISIGETAIAIGNPLGTQFERSVTQGIISGVDRSIAINQGDIMEDLIQTDAAINPGNSGGPLLNSKGEVIGINTVKASAEGLGFAIPINIAKPILAQIIETGTFAKNYIGISAIDREMASYYGSQLGDLKVTKGLYIDNVAANSAAEKAGLQKADVITKINGVEVNTMVRFKSILYGMKAADGVDITFERGGVEKTVHVGIMVQQQETQK